MRALITGATGFVGRKLLARLDYPAIVVSRDTRRADEALAEFAPLAVHAWNPLKEPLPAAALEDVDVIFHLAGEPVAGRRWNAEQKRRIEDSRVLGTRNLVATLRENKHSVRTLISASAVGYYGSRGDEQLTEGSPPGEDFLAHVCQEWEREALAAEELGIRVVCPRIGLVLGHGGALPQMLPPFKMGIGGTLGNGRQWMPWIHVDDLVGLLIHASTSEQMRGPMNAVAPEPVTNREFTKALGRVLHRPTLLPVPYLGLRVLFGEFAKVLFASQKAAPTVAQESGYQFEYTDIERALRSILDKKQSTVNPG